MMFDIDGFKSINDTYGHDVGDRVLIAVADRLKAFVRASDFVARHGGDEFTLLVTGVKDEAEVQKAGERLCNAFREEVVVEGRPFMIGISIGVAVYPENGGDYDLLLKKADEALFAVKREGKNSIRFAS